VPAGGIVAGRDYEPGESPVGVPEARTQPEVLVEAGEEVFVAGIGRGTGQSEGA
jgi:hypothetical protein